MINKLKSILGILFLSIFLVNCNKDEIILPEIQTKPVLFVGVSLLTSGGSVSSLGKPAIHAQGICWNKTGNPTLDDAYIKTDVGANDFILNATGLELGTKYYIRAFVENIDGIIYGDQVSGTTADVYYSETGIFMDSRDSCQYGWVKIGNQTWMAENLRYKSSSIVKYQSSEDSTIYGYLYSYEDAITSCPQGWHLPDSSEWRQLINYFGGFEVAGQYLKKSGVLGWSDPDISSTNNSFFSALPGGHYFYYKSSYQGYENIGQIGYYWVKDDPSNNFYRGIIEFYNNSKAITLTEIYPVTYRWLSVRCVKD